MHAPIGRGIARQPDHQLACLERAQRLRFRRGTANRFRPEHAAIVTQSPEQCLRVGGRQRLPEGEFEAAGSGRGSVGERHAGERLQLGEGCCRQRAGLRRVRMQHQADPADILRERRRGDRREQQRQAESAQWSLQHGDSPMLFCAGWRLASRRPPASLRHRTQ
jgi:hypothetical protein